MTTEDGPFPIRPVSPEEFDGFHAVFMHAFNGSPPTAEQRRRILSYLEFDRSLAAFDGATAVGTAGAYTFQLTVPGLRALPAAGVTWVSVLPSHRRRGVLSSLMRRQLADVRDRREPLAVLWASESVIYPRFGYGRAMWHADFTLYRGEGALARTAPADPGLRLRLVEPAAALPELAKVYDAVLPSRPGFIARDEAWWRREVYDPPEWRQGAEPAALRAGRGRQRPARLRALLGRAPLGPRYVAAQRLADRARDGLRRRRGRRRPGRRPAQPRPDRGVPLPRSSRR